MFADGVTAPHYQINETIEDLFETQGERGVVVKGSGYDMEVETRGQFLLLRWSLRVDQQTTLDTSESGVPAVNGNRHSVVAG